MSCNNTYENHVALTMEIHAHSLPLGFQHDDQILNKCHDALSPHEGCSFIRCLISLRSSLHLGLDGLEKYYCVNKYVDQCML